MLLDYRDLHFALSNNSEFKSGFYTIGSDYFHLNNQFLDENEISKILSKVSDSLEEKEEDEEQKVNEEENKHDVFEQSKQVVKRSIQEELENDYPIMESIEVNNKPIEAEQSSWNIFNFIKNTFSSFFSSIFNWWRVDNVAEETDQPMNAEFLHQDTLLNVEDNYNNNDHNLI